MSARQTVTIRRDEAFEQHPHLGGDFAPPEDHPVRLASRFGQVENDDRPDWAADEEKSALTEPWRRYFCML
jgi:hypothetical protein